MPFPKCTFAPPSLNIFLSIVFFLVAALSNRKIVSLSKASAFEWSTGQTGRQLDSKTVKGHLAFSWPRWLSK